MSYLYLVSRQAISILFEVVFVYCIFINTVNAKTLHDQVLRWKLSDYPADTSVVDKAKSEHAELDAWTSKQTYEIDEPIMLNLSIQNLTSAEILIDVLSPIEKFDLSIREEKTGILPLNEYGKLLKPDTTTSYRKKMGGSQAGIRLKPGEGHDNALPLRLIYDIGVGKYEIIARRKLYSVEKKEVIQLESNPVKFTVIEKAN